MKRKLTAIEYIIDANIVYMVRLEGSFQLDQLRSALSRVQRKHPALRMMIRQEADGLYYEEGCAPELPLRTVLRENEEDYRRECQRELTTLFGVGQPLLRAVWLQAETENELLLVTTHRICDGMSMLTIVREVLSGLYREENLVPYPAITTKDIIGDYKPQRSWRSKLTAKFLNTALWLIPASHRRGENREHFLEWSAGASFTQALKERCKLEGVSIHAALVVALDRTLLKILGHKRVPEWIESPMDARRGRLSALRSDMVFFGGGSLKMRTLQAAKEDFWDRARAVNEDIRQKIDQEMIDIPGRYYLNELLRPVSNGRIQTMVRLGDLLKVNGSWNRFALSNLGNVVVTEPDAPFRLKDLRLYVHSFNFRLLGLVAYALNGEMRFYYVGDEKCLNRTQADALQQEFMTLLEIEVLQDSRRAAEVPQMLSVVAG